MNDYDSDLAGTFHEHLEEPDIIKGDTEFRSFPAILAKNEVTGDGEVQDWTAWPPVTLLKMIGILMIVVVHEAGNLALCKFLHTLRQRLRLA